MEITKLGTPKTVRALLKILNEYLGDTSFGFRNQPIQEL